ncbi:MAG: 4-hydroxy-3-methylbut-2-enyl diphosphate reductase [Desulfobacterota bacterium]|nr:4-hydroxy-3-methylbut-2-enyl diphosphate reductase [Thermodesulfobacteriota bacterium]
MKITVAASAGFCFGVKRAIRIALETAAREDRIEMLGDIVHNEDVVKRIEAAGIRKVKRLTAGKGKVLIIRAHGAAEKVFEKAQALGYRIVDATCPMVKEIHRIVRKREQQGYRCIIIGDPEHEEVHGIQGQIKRRALIIDRVEAIPAHMPLSFSRAAVVVQSTQNSDTVKCIIEELKKRIPELVIHNTICHATRKRQQEIKTMPLKHDVILIIGSRTSANTKRLYEISRSLNSRSYWIQKPADIDPRWLRGAVSVGVTAGASTPEETITSVVAALKRVSDGAEDRECPLP